MPGPGSETVDIGAVRSFPLGEKLRLETRGEFFNALNHTNLGTPNRFVNTAGFGSITEVTTPGREIQLSARLSFKILPARRFHGEPPIVPDTSD